MGNIENASFCFGLFYGVFAVGIIAAVANQIRFERLQMGMKDRTLDKFPDSAQPNMTSSGVVRKSRDATFRYAMLIIVLLAFIGLAIFGIYWVVS